MNFFSNVERWIELPQSMQDSHYIFGLGFSRTIDSGKSKSYYLKNTNLFLVSFVKIFIEFF